MSKLTYHKGQVSEGYDMSIVNDTCNVTVTLVTESKQDVVTPYIFIHAHHAGKQVYYTNETIESIYETFLMTIAEDTSLVDERTRNWATAVLEKANEILNAVISNNGKDTSIPLPNGKAVVLTPCLTDINETDKITRKDIEYILSNDSVVASSHNIFELAASIVNYDKLEKCLDGEKKKLQNYYETYIYPFRNIPHSERTEQLEKDIDFFSDWHKELYGHRPHTDDRNECLKRMQKENAKEYEMNRR